MVRTQCRDAHPAEAPRRGKATLERRGRRVSGPADDGSTFVDRLTGLSDRLGFRRIFEDCCRAQAGGGAPFALMSLDLDRFSVVNQTHGDLVGDLVLGEVARRLQAAVAGTDVVARLGGDEFVILQRNLTGLRQVLGLAERVLALVREPITVQGRPIAVGVSIGIAVAPEDGQGADALKRAADLALDRAKQEGKSACRLFEEEMGARTGRRRILEQALQHAEARGELEVYFQPQVDARSGRLRGAEALLRWTHPDLGPVSPTDFIPVAEEIGLIGSLGEFALRTACGAAAHWPTPLTLAVNLSPMQFQDRRLVRTVGTVLADTGFPPGRLDLEITESVVLNDSGAVRTMLDELRGSGIGIALDDFGTGFSSLTYLSRYPFQKIKIDRSFIATVCENETHAAIVRAVVSLGHSLGVSTVGEGVETPEQARILIEEGCDEIQGYLYGRPMSAETFATLAV